MGRTHRGRSPSAHQLCTIQQPANWEMKRKRRRESVKKNGRWCNKQRIERYLSIPVKPIEVLKWTAHTMVNNRSTTIQTLITASCMNARRESCSFSVSFLKQARAVDHPPTRHQSIHACHPCARVREQVLLCCCAVLPMNRSGRFRCRVEMG